MEDPWAEVSRHPHISVHFDRLERTAGVTDGHSNIWLDDRLTQVERTCALVHELVHLEHGHIGHQTEDVERAVRAETARILIPSDRLWAHRHWHDTLYALAEELGVTPTVLRDRIDTAGPEEIRALQQARWERYCND